MICLTKDDPDIEAECLNRLRNGLVDGILDRIDRTEHKTDP